MPGFRAPSLSMRECAEHTTRIGLIADGDDGLSTAVANDDRYEAVYSAMLERTARPDDAPLVSSLSAGLPNLVQAAASARRRGLAVLGVLGRPGPPVQVRSPS